MGWFSKKKEIEEEAEIPKLPKLPELPELDEEIEQESLPQLPNLPNSSLMKKLSRNAIKEAVSGQKEDEEEPTADEFETPVDNVQMMPKPPQTKKITQSFPEFGKKIKKEFAREIPLSQEKIIPLTREIPERTIVQFGEERRTRRAEPVFIRLDKFEESLRIFEDTKKKIADIEKSLKDIRAVKESEENELNSWEKEFQLIKKQLDKIDKDVFSKIE